MEFVTEREAAEFLNVSEATIRRWVNRRLLTVYHTPTRRRRYKLSELQNMKSDVTPMEVK